MVKCQETKLERTNKALTSFQIEIGSLIRKTMNLLRPLQLFGSIAADRFDNHAFLRWMTYPFDRPICNPMPNTAIISLIIIKIK
jgi:hypothetical protein